jgi:hypothetical protein
MTFAVENRDSAGVAVFLMICSDAGLSDVHVPSSLDIRVGGRAVANIQHSVKEDRRLVASERAERQSIESVFDIAKASTDPGESISEHLDGLACMLWGNEIPQCLPK